MRSVIILFLVIAVSTVYGSGDFQSRLEVQELDHPYVLAHRHATFFASVSRPSPTCGWLRDYSDVACFYCVGAICDTLQVDDTLVLTHEDDVDGCANRLRILTNKRENGMCGPWIDRIGMISTPLL